MVFSVSLKFCSLEHMIAKLTFGKFQYLAVFSVAEKTMIKPYLVANLKYQERGGSVVESLT